MFVLALIALENEHLETSLQSALPDFPSMIS